MDILALAWAWALPWILGVALLAALARPTATRERSGILAWRVGCGWFAGAFVLTLWMRVLSAAGVKFGVVAIAVPLAALAAAAAWLAWRGDRSAFARSARAAWRVLAGSDLVGGTRIAWLALLGWLVVRFALLLADVAWRPLFPWDAWSHWATKARVWFQLRAMVPFVGPSEWLQLAGGAYTDANPHYPGTVPLLQVWGATAIGRWDDALINLPWWLMGIALAVAIYGFLAQRGWTPLWALTGAWLVASMPILDVHVALAGYADLPMAAYVTLAVLAGWRWAEDRGRDDAALALLFVAACVLVKNPGKVWVLVMLPGAVAALMPRYGVRAAIAGLVGAIAVLVVLARLDLVLLGYRLHLEFALPWRGLAEAYLVYANWHLLWYGVVAAAILGRHRLLSRELAPLTLVLAAGLLFLFFGFAFTNARFWVEDQSTVNRATLHLAPLLVVWTLLALRAWVAELKPAAVESLATEAAAPPAPGYREPNYRAPMHSVPVPQAPAPRRAPPEPAAPGAGSAAGAPVPATGRNDPCPCGSGKRYKHCHGDVVAPPSPAAAPLPADALVARALEAHQRGELDDAERDYRAALAVAPEHPHALHFLGVVHYQRGMVAAALPLLERAVARIPQEPEFHNNLGLALAAADREHEAIAAYRRALALKPDHAVAWNNLGLALQATNDLPAAIDAFHAALRFAPDFAQAHWNLGLALLAAGDYAAGWREYEWRLALAALGKHGREYPGPRWPGGDPAGKTLLLTHEQGFGDTLQFARFAQVLSRRGARVRMEVPEPLLTLIARMPDVVDACAPGDPLPAYDAHLPLLSVPAALGIDADSIPRDVPYLACDPRHAAAVAAELAPFATAFKVGLAWAGNRAQANDRHRSCPLAALAPLLATPGVAWFSLQRDDGEDQIAGVPAARDLVLLDARRDFEPKAALMAALDLVISVDTSTAHLAGALARPLWVLLTFAPDWRWQLDRADSPWYPTARLFRQAQPGDWPAVIRDVQHALEALVAGRR